MSSTSSSLSSSPGPNSWEQLVQATKGALLTANRALLAVPPTRSREEDRKEIEYQVAELTKRLQLLHEQRSFFEPPVGGRSSSSSPLPAVPTTLQTGAD